MSRIPGTFQLLVVLLALGAVGCGGDAEETAEGEAPPPSQVAVVESELSPEAVKLYYPAGNGRLYAEARELPGGLAPEERLARLVEAYLAGPQTAALRQTMPPGVAVGSVVLRDDGIILLDLEAPQDTPPPMGSASEISVVYSLVSSVVLNVAEAERLVLLWNGAQRSTFAGHLDTTRPLMPDPSRITSGEPPGARSGSRPPPAAASPANGDGGSPTEAVSPVSDSQEN